MSRCPQLLARSYFAVQAASAALWWALVFTLPTVREATLGRLDPALVGAFDVPLFAVASLLAACGARWATWVAWPWTLFVTVALTAYAATTGSAGWGVLAMLAASCGTTVAAMLLLWGRVPTELLLTGPLRIRVASEASAARHSLATGAQIVVFWGLFLAVIPLAITALETRVGLQLTMPLGLRIAGVSLLAAASALGLWAAAAMSTRGAGTPLPSATARKLVVAGPYLLVRNPMAVAGITQGVAVGLLLGSWLVVVYALAGSLVWNWGVRPHEEADLEARFGDEYRAYRSAVRCWVPGWPVARRSRIARTD
ncbi:methyltransferase family protein [Leucobacter sp. HY1910]